jgi:hypothetical protein
MDEWRFRMAKQAFQARLGDSRRFYEQPVEKLPVALEELVDALLTENDAPLQLMNLNPQVSIWGGPDLLS